jgi:hypothetical protein
MIDGIYSIAFTGRAGSGFGMLALFNSIVAGADIAGAVYDGTYLENTTAGCIDFDVKMMAPAGLAPVQTGEPLTSPMELPIAVSLPADLGGEQPVLVRTQLGPVNMVFRKIRDLPTR